MIAFWNVTGPAEVSANVINRGLIPMQVAAGVTADSGNTDEKREPILTAKYPGLHALRCINRVDEGGLALPPKTVQVRMGHSSITMTMDVYGHLFPSIDDSDALAEQRLLSAANATWKLCGAAPQDVSI